MKKYLSIITACILACTSLTACNSGDSKDERGSDKKSVYGCGSKYALSDEDYRYESKSIENEVYLIAAKLSGGKEIIKDNDILSFVYFSVGEQIDYKDEAIYKLNIRGMDLETVKEHGLYDGADIFLLFKKELRPLGQIDSWLFLNEEKSESFFPAYNAKLSVELQYKPEDFKYKSSLNNCSFLGDKGYIFTSAKEADKAYEKMIEEGGISTVKYRKVPAEEK